MIHHYMVKKILHEKRMLDLVAFHGFLESNWGSNNLVVCNAWVSQKVA